MEFIDQQHIIEYYKSTVVQIATPFSTGTGFYSQKYKVIITNEHVVRDNKKVLVQGIGFEKYLAQVMYLDSNYDIALLKGPETHQIPVLSFGNGKNEKVGDKVIAVGHPFGLKYTATSGVISNLDHFQHDIRYIQHDAALNPGNSGGPLINLQGQVIGINTFVIKNGSNIGFSLPIAHLLETLNNYSPNDHGPAIRCDSCRAMIIEKENQSPYCTNCGTKVMQIGQIEGYEPVGVAQTIEAMLDVMDYTPELCRKGLNNWQLTRGSANIKIAYHEKSGLILADASICDLPSANLKELYKYLLKENYKPSGLTFSVRNGHIIISLLIYDQYLNVNTSRLLFEKLFDAADYYDNVLEDRFDAKIKGNNVD